MAATPQEIKKYMNKGRDTVEEGLPGWFGTFADMMTLLFAFFVLFVLALFICFSVFESGQITPGTDWLTDLCEWLHEMVERKQKEVDSQWSKIKVIIDDVHVPGEGEHKIFHYLRKRFVILIFFYFCSVLFVY